MNCASCGAQITLANATEINPVLRALRGRFCVVCINQRRESDQTYDTKISSEEYDTPVGIAYLR